jgi:hypothetical protein
MEGGLKLIIKNRLGGVSGLMWLRIDTSDGLQQEPKLFFINFSAFLDKPRNYQVPKKKSIACN